MFQNLLGNLGLEDFDIVGSLIRVLVIVISLTVHEVSHGIRAYQLGDDTAQKAGRLTLNPLAHLDPLGTLMMFVAKVDWAKPVPINPVLFTRAKTMKRGIVEVSLAGPVSNFILSFVSYFLFTVIYLISAAMTKTLALNSIVEVILTILYTMTQLNVYLAIFNLLPIPPLDGFKIFGSLLPSNLYYKLMNYERYIGIVFIAIIFFARGAFSMVLTTIAAPFLFIIEKPMDLLFYFILNMIK